MAGNLTTHADHKYRITIHSDDISVVNSLRALSKYSQKAGNNNIPWGGTKDKDWEKDRHEVTFHFSDPAYREGFVSELRRLLSHELWREVRRNDNHPAKPAK